LELFKEDGIFIQMVLNAKLNLRTKWLLDLTKSSLRQEFVLL